MLLKSNCGPSSRMIDVADDVVPREGKLIVFNLLQENNVEVERADECAESLYFRCVGDRVDVDCADVNTRVLHYCWISSPESRLCLMESFGRIFFPGGDLLLRWCRLLIDDVDV